MRPALVTAGATRNPVDAIRYISAHATGTTGVALSSRLAGKFDVRLLGSAEACLRARLDAPGVSTEEYLGTRDLMARMEAALRSHPGGVLVHSAAVGDYEMNAVPTKLPSGQPELVLRLTPGPKIVDHVREWDPDVFLVSFKAGSPDWDEAKLESVARAQLVRTRSDLVFANRIGALDTSCLLLEPTGTTRFATRADALDALTARLEARA
jgi:phosphopantothenoylcysteine decarboxylase/phosphopantothenate--cysteine ligase